MFKSVKKWLKSKPLFLRGSYSVLIIAVVGALLTLAL